MSINAVSAIQLPRGLWLENTRHQQAELRPLSGDDEALLLDAGESLLPAERNTVLLTRCLKRLGPLAPVTAEAVRSLTIGDREALLLQLRRLTFGESLQCVLSCPAKACGEKMDLELNVAELLLEPYPDARSPREATIGQNGTTYRVRFHLPTGADQEETARVAMNDTQRAADLLLRRCVEQVVTVDDRAVADLPPIVAHELPELMSELDPQAELMLNVTCSACGHVFTALLDAGAYLYQELENRARHLFREVHLLAFHYHWSESEIMAMTSTKRGRYLELLADALGKEGSR